MYIWNVSTGKIERKFGGHFGSVNETCFNKMSSIISSVSSDKLIINNKINKIIIDLINNHNHKYKHKPNKFYKNTKFI